MEVNDFTVNFWVNVPSGVQMFQNFSPWPGHLAKMLASTSLITGNLDYMPYELNQSCPKGCYPSILWFSFE